MKGFCIIDEVAWVDDRELRWARAITFDAEQFHVRGFYLPFESGWGLSVHWGSLMRATNRFRVDFLEASPTAEIVLVHLTDLPVTRVLPGGQYSLNFVPSGIVLDLIDEMQHWPTGFDLAHSTTLRIWQLVGTATQSEAGRE